MKLIVLLYIFVTIAYFYLSEASMYWGLLNSLNTLGFMVVLLNNKFKKDTYTRFAIYLTVGRIIYTSICAISAYEWIYAMNKVFATIFLIWLIITIIIEKTRATLIGGQK